MKYRIMFFGGNLNGREITVETNGALSKFPPSQIAFAAPTGETVYRFDPTDSSEDLLKFKPQDEMGPPCGCVRKAIEDGGFEGMSVERLLTIRGCPAWCESGE